MSRKLILGIESSCDETSASVVRGGTEVLSNVVASQLIHADYGGVVPELASREHLRAVTPVVREAMHRAGVTYEDLAAIAVTEGPGIAGALLVGITFAKSLAFAAQKPLIAVNHLEGHIHAVLMHAQQTFANTNPLLALVVSGGHTHLYLATQHDNTWHYRNVGKTLDDAAGEAFDKVAKLLGLPYPGGPWMDALAPHGDPKAVPFTFAQIKTKATGKTAPKLSREFVLKGAKRSDADASQQSSNADALSLKGENFTPATERSLKGQNFTPATERSLKGENFTPATEQSLKGENCTPATEQSLKGTGFSPATERSLKGTGFSPSINASEEEGALAPEGTRFDLSFSGIKTAVRRYVELHHMQPAIETRAEYLRTAGLMKGKPSDADTFAKILASFDPETLNLIASFQSSVTKYLTRTTLAAAEHYGARGLVVTGGVAANSELRRSLTDAANKRSLPIAFPTIALSTDNAAMIAAAAYPKLIAETFAPLTLEPTPQLRLG